MRHQIFVAVYKTVTGLSGDFLLAGKATTLAGAKKIARQGQKHHSDRQYFVAFWKGEQPPHMDEWIKPASLNREVGFAAI